jgi:hypothetical protein
MKRKTVLSKSTPKSKKIKLSPKHIQLYKPQYKRTTGQMNSTKERPH